MEVDEPPKTGLFAQCNFAIVRSATLSTGDAEQIAHKFRLHDAETVIDQYNEHRLSLQGITHVISTTSDFPDYDAVCDALIPVVKPVWIDHSLAKDKLVNTRSYSPDPRLFMSEVVACCVDLPDGDTDAIAGGILATGGLFSSRLTSQVSHIVALTMDSEQCVTVVKRNLNIKIVLPHWFDDCLKLGKKIDEQPYLLPDPEILKTSLNKAPVGIQTGRVTGAVHPDPSFSPPPTPSGTRTGQNVFRRKNVMLGTDLRIGSHLRGVLEGIILAGGGKIITSVRKADIFVCKYRDGQDYKIASRAGKDVGNLAWLYYLITTDNWTSPTKRLLHYPVAREGLPGFKDYKISLSNYSGEARTYLENLIIATGAQCTKTLKQDNTHLITAHIVSEKSSAARDWGIHLINHLWLEESYAKWQLQSVSNSRYTHFPRRTNLGEVVGHTQIDRTVLETCFYPESDTEMTDDPKPTMPMRQVDQNTLANNDNLARSESPSRPEPKPNSNMEKDGSSDQATSARYQTPATSRFASFGKENITPSTNSTRKSKDAAAAKLQSMTPDIALYEKERKRVGGVVYGGRRKKDEDRVSTTRKRSVDEASDSDAVEDYEVKKPRTGPPSPSIHLLISGYKKWVGQTKLEEADKKHLRNLGIIITADPARATHLAAPNVLRTQKFVTALAYAPHVISTNFIDACLEGDEVLDPNKFILVDKVNEKKFGLSLKLSRERAKENRNQLLHGQSLYCFETIHGGFDTFKSIVEANGGQCILWKSRKGAMVPSSRAESALTLKDESFNEVYLVSDPDEESSSSWPRFKKMVEASRRSPRVVSADWLIETAMCQKVLPTKKYELKEKSS